MKMKEPTGLRVKPGSWLEKHVKEAQEEIETWPKWMQELGAEDMYWWGKDRG